MTPADAAVLLRIVPLNFQTPDHSVAGNLVYQRVNGVNRLVGQLEETRRVLPVDQAARFFGGGGQAALTALSAVGNIAAIANLGVCVVGFVHVSRALGRIEARFGRAEQKFDAMAELVGVIDQKVDQLLVLGDAQVRALSDLHNRLLSFQTAGVHAALETLEFRRSEPPSAHRNADLLAAARTLQSFRLWLAKQRESAAIRPAPARAELLRAEVLVILAEARARCLADDAPFAVRALESVLDAVRDEASKMRSELLAAASIPAILDVSVPGVDDMQAEYAAIGAWLDRNSLDENFRHLLRETSGGHRELSRKMRMLQEYMVTLKEAFEETLEVLADPGAQLKAKVEVLLSQFPLIGPLVENPSIFRAPSAPQAEVSSLVVVARLGRSLADALALAAAIEILGEPAKELLDSSAAAESPALSVQLVPAPEKVGG